MHSHYPLFPDLPVPSPHPRAAPGERYEVILDFSNLTVGEELILANLNGTFTDGSGASPFFCYSHLIMKFIVQVGVSQGGYR